MSNPFLDPEKQIITNKKLFGICDDPPPPHAPAYLDETDGAKWIAVVVNEYGYEVKFMPIDNNLKFTDSDGKQTKSCDGVLMCDSTIIFVELKEKGVKGNEWIKEAEKQLRASIAEFEKTEEAEGFKQKYAYIANSERPRNRETQIMRMQKFLNETGYRLLIQNRIVLG